MMDENSKFWNQRWRNEHKIYQNFEGYYASMGVVVRDLLKELKKNINHLKVADNKIADLGGGYGAILNFLFDNSNEKHLIEISETAIKIAEKYYNIHNTHLIDFTKENFYKTNYFDLVLCNEVLEHLHPQDIDSFLGNLYEIIKPGGKVLISTPNIRSLTSFFLMLFGWNPFIFKMDNTHICPFTIKELSIKMEKNGFKMIKTYTTKALLFKTEKFYIRFPFRWSLGEHIIGVWEK